MAYKKENISFIKNIFFAVIYVATGTLILFTDSKISAIILMETFLSVVFVNRVLSAITEKELSYKLINILLSVFLAYVLIRSLFFKEDNLIYYMSLYAIFVVVKMLAHIIVVAFARIRIGVLRKIIRKTYAAEILSIYGIFVVALLTSIIVNFYNEIKDEKKDDIKGSDEKPEDKEIADSDKE